MDGAAGDIGVGGDVVVVQSVALEPEDLHLALDAGVGVMVPVVGQGPPIVWAEGDDPHDGSTWCCPQVVARQQFMPMRSRLQFVPVPAAQGLLNPQVAATTGQKSFGERKGLKILSREW